MEPAVWISIYLPIFIIFFIIIPNQKKIMNDVLRKVKKRKKEGRLVTNKLIKKYLGKKCKVYSGSFGTNVKGKLKELEDNWLEVETSKEIELVNIDFIQNIKIIER